MYIPRKLRREWTAGLALAAALFLTAGSAEAVAGQPRLVMAEKIFAAGPVPAGSVVSHDFILENTGQADLEIIQVVPGCGCTVADFDRLIPPGGQGRITLKVEFYAEWAGRHLNQATLVETNDPENQYVTLTVSADVQPAEVRAD